MERIFTYQKLETYTKAKILVMECYRLLKVFPPEEKYALSDQIRRAVISVPSNIAEGMGRPSIKEQIHFLEIAYGSLMEVHCQMDIAKDLQYISEEEFKIINHIVGDLARMITGLRNRRAIPSPLTTHPSPQQQLVIDEYNPNG